DVRAQNRRGAEPIHYAADGVAGGEHWNPQTQAETIAYLVAAGADPNAAGSRDASDRPGRVRRPAGQGGAGRHHSVAGVTESWVSEAASSERSSAGSSPVTTNPRRFVERVMAT